METTYQRVDHIAIVRFSGEMVRPDIGPAQKRIEPIAAQGNHLIFDLSGVDFMDGAGLGFVLGCLRRLQRQGGQLKLSGLNRQVRMLFELLNLHRVFEIFNEPHEAVRAFGRRGILSAA